MWCSQISVFSVGQKGFKLASSVHPGAMTPNITKLLLADPFGEIYSPLEMITQNRICIIYKHVVVQIYSQNNNS